jgi:hypothetical protein
LIIQLHSEIEQIKADNALLKVRIVEIENSYNKPSWVIYMFFRLLKKCVKYHWRLILSFVLFLMIWCFPMTLWGLIEYKLVPNFLLNHLPFLIMWMLFPIAGLVCCYDMKNCCGLKWYLYGVMILIHIGCMMFIVYFIYGHALGLY